MRIIITLVTLTLLLAACGVQNEVPEADPGEGPASETTNPTTIPEDAENFSLLLTDAPTDDAAWLRVDFGRIGLVPAEGTETGVVTVSDDGGTIENLLELDNGATRTLEEGVEVPDGTYEQIRIVVDEVTIAFPDGKGGVTTRPVKLPSERLQIAVEPALVVEGGAASRVVLDFDAAKAVHTAGKSGKFILKPTAIRAVTVSGVLEGRVVDAAGDPVADASVDVYEGAYEEGEAPVVSARTEADGGYRIVTLLEGDYTVVARAEGYEASVVEDVTIAAHETTALDPVSLAEITTGTLTDTVSDAGGEPIAGAVVSVHAEGSLGVDAAPIAQAYTRADGTFVLDALPEGTYDVTVAADGYLAATYEGVSIAADATAELVVDADVVLEAVEVVGTLEGTVTDAGGAALDGARFLLYEGETVDAGELPAYETYTTADGSYVVEDVAVGTYAVVVEAEGYAEATGGTITIAAGGTAALDVVLDPLVEEAPADAA